MQYAYIRDNSIFCTSPRSIKQLPQTEEYTEDVTTTEVVVNLDTNESETKEVTKQVTKIREVMVDNPDLVDCTEVEYSDTITNPTYDKKSGKVIQLVSEEELQAEKKKKKIAEFVATENIEGFDWEGIVLDVDDYGKLIVARNFSGDKDAQIAMLSKIAYGTAVIFKHIGVPKELLQAVYGESFAVYEQVSKTRVASGLNPFPLDPTILS